MIEPVKYITKVEIQGLFGRYDIEWNLHSDVNVLAGINGSGKSTILTAIFRLFDSELILYLNKVEHIKLTFNTDDYIGRTTSFVYNDEIEEAFPVIDPVQNINISVIREKLRVGFIRTFDSVAKPKELLQKTGNEVKTELDYELWLLQKEYTKYQVRIYKYDSEINRATHKRFLAIIDELFAETDKRVNPDKEELEFLLGDKEISAYQLSSGEKQLLVILLTVLVQDNKPSILLMDEPEISLHIEWQRKLIQYVRELNPNAQVIVATHSPDIVPDGCLDKIFNLQDLIVKDNLVP